MSFFDTTAGKVISIVVILAIVAVGVWYVAVRMAPATDSPSDVTNLMPHSDPNAPDLAKPDPNSPPLVMPGAEGPGRR